MANQNMFSSAIVSDVVPETEGTTETPVAPVPDVKASQSETEIVDESSGNDGTSIKPINKGDKAPQTKEGNETKPDVKSINDLISKAGLTYKANGKTYKVDNIESLLKVASRSKPIEDSLGELQKQREMLTPVAELIQQLRGEDDEASEQALMKLITPDRVNKIAEKMLRKQYEDELRGGPMTEREKELKRQLDDHQRQVKDVELQKQREEQAIRQQKEQEQVNAVREHMAANVTQALELMDLPAKLEPMAVEFMKPIMRSLLKNGISLTPEVLAEKVGPMFEDMLAYKTKNLEGEKLLKFLGDDVGKRVRQALLAKMQPAAPKGAPRSTTTSNKELTPLSDIFKKTVF